MTYSMAQATLDLADAAQSINHLIAEMRNRVRAPLAAGDGLSAEGMQNGQRLLHGLAWFGTYALAIEECGRYRVRMSEAGRLGALEDLLVRVGVGEYLEQVFSSIAMSQVENIRLSAYGFTAAEITAFRTPSIDRLIADGNTAGNRLRLVALLQNSIDTATPGDAGLEDDLESMRAEMRDFCAREIAPHANGWHIRNEYIPMSVIDQLAALGVFSVSIPESYGGMGLSKVAMCVVSEELSRGYLGVGSLGTRAEIAAELILASGTDEQKQRFLPRLASGELLATAVFTEPDTGSDLASLRTRAEKTDTGWSVTGNKTWITHPVRADLMTILVRTNPGKAGFDGLSLLLAEKTRGTDESPFPDRGLSGSEIEVIGYRGMKEFELSFEGFHVPADNLLAGREGEGFRQLMRTFESARIQTAARAVGVAQAALDVALQYSRERKQFGKPIISFPRVADKIAAIAAELHLVRLLTYHAGRVKDSGRRCDQEAGMAKLLAARLAWAAADNAVQIHGGNGFAVEFPVSRLLCDARVLSIFEGSSEIQAQVIARRMVEKPCAAAAAVAVNVESASGTWDR